MSTATQTTPAARPEAPTVHPEAERAVIAALIRNANQSDIDQHGIIPDLFGLDATRKAFEAITKVWRDGATPDAATLRDALEPATYIELETTLAENVSGANLSYHVAILKSYKRARKEAELWDELDRKRKAGAPPHEVSALFDKIRAVGSGDLGDTTMPPPFRPLNLDAMESARLHPRCIVENLLYADLAVMNAEGGTGKTTLLLYEAIHIALRRDLWGCRVLNPGRTLFITAEDGEELLQARLREVMTALNLTDYERRKVCESICIWDVTGSLVRLAELDARGNLQLTALADRIVETYRDAGLVQVIFDPAISFSPGERIVNDGEQAIVTACRRIIRGLNCCVRLIHHSGQSNARNGAIDQYAGRGGTALPDGARMVTILASANRVNLARPEGFDLQPGEFGFVMARAKLSYAPPQPNIWIRRRGWTFNYFIEEPRNSDAVRDHDADKVAEFLTEEFHHGRRYTANTLELSGKAGMPRARLRAALATLETSGRLEERDLPADQRRGKRKTYLHPNKPADPSGGIAADKPPNEPTATPNPPPVINPPPYRETRNGGIDAVPVSPISTNPPANNGGIAAEWRNSDEPATQPDQPPPEEPDIPSALPAETSIETATLVDKTPDIIRDNPQPPAEPLAVELAKAASLDIGRMLSGKLTDDDWSKLTHGAVKLSESLDKAGKDALSTLLDRIDAAFNSQPTEVRS